MGDQAVRLTSRLRRLEATKRQLGDCPRCHGRGWPHHFVQGPDHCDLTTKPGDPVGCDRCGRVSMPQLIVLDKNAPNPLEAWLAAGGVAVG